MQARWTKPEPIPDEVQISMSLKEAILIRDVIGSLHGNNKQVSTVYDALHELNMPDAKVGLKYTDGGSLGVWGDIEIKGSKDDE